ncbi:MAG: porin [Hyphomicrobiaceae bacterium]|nr:porin [Hyphomicrobiaceae bacterium]
MIGGLFKSASRVAIVAAAGILAGGVAAQAADLGGNCCADLEERVAELEATTARKGNRKVSLTVYGQVNKALLWHDDETDVPGLIANGGTDINKAYRPNRLSVQDNDAGVSRFGFKGEAKVTSDVALGYRLEAEWSTGNSSAAISTRHNHLYVKSASLGTLHVGQTSSATDGIFEINLASTTQTFSGMDEGADVSTVINVYGALMNGDGARVNGVHYVSPTFAGFAVSASWIEGGQFNGDNTPTDDVYLDGWDVALRYAGEFNGVRFAAGIGYRQQDVAVNDPASLHNDDRQTVTISGSASVMHVPTGLYLSGAYADYDADGGPATVALATGLGGGMFELASIDRSMWAVQGGIQQKFNALGNTTVFGEYGQIDVDLINRDLSYWGLGINQGIDAAAAQLYLNYRHYDTDGIGLDTNIVVGGLLITF